MRAANVLAPPALVQIGVGAAIGCYAWGGTTDNFGALCRQVARACRITNSQVTKCIADFMSAFGTKRT